MVREQLEQSSPCWGAQCPAPHTSCLIFFLLSEWDREQPFNSAFLSGIQLPCQGPSRSPRCIYQLYLILHLEPTAVDSKLGHDRGFSELQWVSTKLITRMLWLCLFTGISCSLELPSPCWNKELTESCPLPCSLGLQPPLLSRLLAGSYLLSLPGTLK